MYFFGARSAKCQTLGASSVLLLGSRRFARVRFSGLSPNSRHENNERDSIFYQPAKGESGLAFALLLIKYFASLWRSFCLGRLYSKDEIVNDKAEKECAYRGFRKVGGLDIGGAVVAGYRMYIGLPDGVFAPGLRYVELPEGC